MNDEVRAIIRTWLTWQIVNAELTPEERKHFIEKRTETMSQGSLGQSLQDYYDEHGEYPEMAPLGAPYALKVPKSELKIKDGVDVTPASQ
jgi:hypothetical protein